MPMGSIDARTWGGMMLLITSLGCAADLRPVIENGSDRILKLRSTHRDGHSLGIVLGPGARIWLGTVRSPLEDIEWDVAEPATPGAEKPGIDKSVIDRCLDANRTECLGWRIVDSGLEPLP